MFVNWYSKEYLVLSPKITREEFVSSKMCFQFEITFFIYQNNIFLSGVLKVKRQKCDRSEVIFPRKLPGWIPGCIPQEFFQPENFFYLTGFFFILSFLVNLLGVFFITRKLFGLKIYFQKTISFFNKFYFFISRNVFGLGFFFSKNKKRSIFIHFFLTGYDVLYNIYFECKYCLIQIAERYDEEMPHFMKWANFSVKWAAGLHIPRNG